MLPGHFISMIRDSYQRRDAQSFLSIGPIAFAHCTAMEAPSSEDSANDDAWRVARYFYAAMLIVTLV